MQMSLSVCLRKETMKSLLVSARLARPETFAILRTKYFTLVGLSEWGDTGMSSLHKVEVCHGTYTFHGLRGSASPVLTATGFVNGRWQFSTPHRINTP